MGHHRFLGWLHPGLLQLHHPGSVVWCPSFGVRCISWAFAEESSSFLSLLKAGSVVGQVSWTAQFPQVRGLQPSQYSHGIILHSVAGVPFFVFHIGAGSSGGSFLSSLTFPPRGSLNDVDPGPRGSSSSPFGGRLLLDPTDDPIVAPWMLSRLCVWVGLFLGFMGDFYLVFSGVVASRGWPAAVVGCFACRRWAIS